MKIGIDGNEANEVRSDIAGRAGVNYYAFKILEYLYKLNEKQRDKVNYVIYLKSSPNNDLPKEEKWWRYKVISGSGKWIFTKLTPFLVFTKEKPDVFFSPSHYLPLALTIPKVCTIHDLGYLNSSGQFKRADFWQLKYWSAISISVSKYIISVSNSTKNDIVRHYPTASKKVRIVHHGYDKEYFNTNIKKSIVRHVKNIYKIDNDYLLFLSTLKPSKNIIKILEAYSKLKTDFKLVIAGGKGWYFNEVYKKATDLKLGNRIVFTGYVGEKNKPALMHGAKLFLSPSIWEGFGMHVLEAMACGTPVVVSKVASLPEVAGDAGVYVDPENSESIRMGIKKVLEMPEKRYNMLVAKTLDQVKDFSWEKSARETLAVLKKAGN
jgi:glycosyltransferase involved in cell wall biosynthesis